VPIIGLAMPRITARTSAKSRLIRPSLTIRSVMQLTPEYSTWSAILKASAKVVFSLATRNRFCVRDDDERVDVPVQLVDPVFRKLGAAVAFEGEGLGHDADGEDTLPLAPLARSPAQRRCRCRHPCQPVMNTICEPLRWSLISSKLSVGCGAPDLRVRSSAEALRYRHAELDDAGGFAERQRCASVLAQTKSTPSNPCAIILLTAFPPAPPTPNTVMRGFTSWMSGMARLMVMNGPMALAYGVIVSRQFVNRTLTIRANPLTVRCNLQRRHKGGFTVRSA